MSVSLASLGVPFLSGLPKARMVTYFVYNIASNIIAGSKELFKKY
jgi:hypothetical protein